MTKVILKGPPSASWHLDGTFVQAHCERDLTPKQLKEAEKSNLIESYVEPESTSAKVTEEVPQKKVKVYAEKELFDMNKAQQVKIIEKLGLKPASREADRVKQIMEAQNDK